MKDTEGNNIYETTDEQKVKELQAELSAEGQALIEKSLRNREAHRDLNDRFDAEEYEYHLLFLPSGIKRFYNLGTVEHVKQGTALNEPDTIPDWCYVIKKGRVLCYEISYEGERRAYNIMEPNSIFLEDCLLFHRKCPIQFRTLTDAELIKIDRCVLVGAMKRDFDLSMDIMESLTVKFLSSMENQRIGPQQQAAWKVARLLYIYAEHYGVAYDGKILIREKLTQQSLAEILGLNRVTVARKLKELKDMALVEQINGYYCVRSMEKLYLHMEHLKRVNY